MDTSSLSAHLPPKLQGSRESERKLRSRKVREETNLLITSNDTLRILEIQRNKITNMEISSKIEELAKKKCILKNKTEDELQSRSKTIISNSSKVSDAHNLVPQARLPVKNITARPFIYKNKTNSSKIRRKRRENHGENPPDHLMSVMSAEVEPVPANKAYEPSISFSHNRYQSFSARNPDPQTYQIDSSPFSYKAKQRSNTPSFKLPPLFSNVGRDHHQSHYPSRFGPPASTPLPSFDMSTPSNITAQQGSNTFLLCRIRNLSNQSVSNELFTKIDYVKKYTST